MVYCISLDNQLYTMHDYNLMHQLNGMYIRRLAKIAIMRKLELLMMALSNIVLELGYMMLYLRNIVFLDFN